MTDDGVDRAREIFKEAIDLSGAERDAFVETASAGDEWLRNRVERLLKTFDSDASKLGETNLTVVSPGTRIGTQIGRFRILKMIGEGGFGEVWLAEQTEPVRRRVAIKIIKRGMDSAQVVARFEAERQALAMMEHPNIARVYDGGETDEGRLYFVMELVKGMPITEYCERRKLG
ncbi:MAG: protein kinase, partial [Phycisphaerales bacterium]|nr:protein kinase [Phycisphaerales bacterium]